MRRATRLEVLLWGGGAAGHLLDAPAVSLPPLHTLLAGSGDDSSSNMLVLAHCAAAA
jgi:hypothetical protein